VNDRDRQVTVKWEDISPSLKIAAERSGLEYMQAILSGEAPAPPIAYLMNMQFSEIANGRAVFTGTPGEQHFNPMGTVHGGFAATLMDSALGCAVHTTLPQGMLYGTAQLNVNYTRPIMPDVGTLICAADVIHRGKRMVTAEATLKDEGGKLYAHGTTTCFTFPIQQ
jgi:uncharacterized protein (TIGR00369 family)